VGKSMPTFIHGSVTSTKPNFNPKTLKFVEKDTNFGKCKFFLNYNYSTICGTIHVKHYSGTSHV
jgi:hypothetical protein